MKKKLIDKNLIVEGVLQLKIAGIILLLISFLGTLIMPIARFFEIANHRQNGITNTYLKVINIVDIAPILLLFMIIGPLIFTFTLFSFLNKRSSSDFYHSISCNRIALFNSFVVSIIIWTFGTIIICVAAGSIAYSIIGIHINFSYIMWLLGTLLAGSLLVMTCALFAMTITGTLFTNIMVFGMIFLLPRLILLMFNITLEDCVKIFILSDTNIMNYDNNIPIKFLFRALGSNISSNYLYSSASAIIYTLVLAIIYYMIACLLFNYRKSEIAGTSAPNKVLQHCYRCIVTLPFALFIPVIIMTSSGEPKPVIGIAICVIISLLVYYIYELLTTKSFKNALKSTPFLLVVAALTAVFGISLNISRNYILSFTPSASEIKYVTFLPNNSDRFGSDYYTIAARNINYTEDSIKDKISNILKTNIGQLGGEIYRKDSAVPVKITLKNGRSARRVLYMTSDEYSSITDSMMKNEEYRNVMKTLPPEKTISNVSFTDLGSSNNIWNSYKNEFSTLPDTVKENLIDFNTPYGSNSISSNVIGEISVTGSLNMYNYMSNFRITTDTPETAKLYVNTVNSDNKDTFTSFINAQGDAVDIYELNISIINGKSNNNEDPDANVFSLTDKTLSDNSVKGIINIVKKQSDDGQINLSDTFIKLNCISNKYEFTYFLPISSDDAAQLLKYKGN